MNSLYMRNFVCVCTLLLPVIAFAQIPVRKYKVGDTYKYKLTTEHWRNDKFSGKTVSIAEHHIVNDAGILAEEIKWISKTSYNETASGSLDSFAKMVTPYRISLLPSGK